MGPSILHRQCGYDASDRDPLSSPVMWHWLLGRFVCSTVLGSRPAPAPCRAAACRWPSPNGPRNPGPAAATTAVAADLKPGPRPKLWAPASAAKVPSHWQARVRSWPEGQACARGLAGRQGQSAHQRQHGVLMRRPGLHFNLKFCFSVGTCERSGALAHQSDSESSATT